jgi:signal transduction histidine kinase
LHFPDRIIAVDGADLTSLRDKPCGRSWDRAVEAAAARGHTSVHATVVTATAARNVELAITPLEPEAWWLYGGGLILVGALYVVAALTALAASPRGKLARIFARTAFLCALYFFSFFDVHTARTLIPVGYLGFALLPGSFVLLALRLPDDAPILTRKPWIPPLIDVLGLGLAGGLVVGHMMGQSTLGLRQVCTLLLGSAFLFFVVALLVRFFRAIGTRRDILRALLFAMVPAYGAVGLGILVASMSSMGSTAAFLALPASALAPFATTVAFIRHDLWGSRALLSRVLTRSIFAAAAGAFAVAVGAAFAASLGVPFRYALIAAAAGGIASASLVYVALRLVDRSFFPAIAHYKPSVAHLSEELTSITATAEVAHAVERTVRRWLACDRAELTPCEPHPPTGSDPLPVLATDVGREDLAMRVSFGGHVLGVLHVGRKRGRALFTSEDLDLLNTITNQAALALAYAHSYAELEQRRQQQAAAWQTERLALVETVAAEIAHEVRYPINFFRSIFRRERDARRPLDGEEIDIGCEEVDRLERLVAGLRRVVGHRIERRLTSVADLAARTEVLLRDALGTRDLELSVPEGVGLRCNPDQATQVLANLVSNALEAVGPRGRVGIAWESHGDGADLVVWDDGPGFEGDASQLFAPWFTTKPRGTGLGLAITQRIVRAHGWSVDAMRLEGRTRFVIAIPASDVVNATAARRAAMAAAEVA